MLEKPLSKTDSKIIELYKAGNNATTISRKLCVKKSYIIEFLTARGLHRRQKRYNDVREHLEELARSGYNAEQIMKEAGVSRNTAVRAISVAALEAELEAENNLVRADRTIHFKRCMINGKKYLDVTEIFSGV